MKKQETGSRKREERIVGAALMPPVSGAGSMIGRDKSCPYVALFCLSFLTFSFFTQGACLAQTEAQAQEASVSAPSPPETKVTLELQGVNILDLLKLLAKRSGLNIVAGRNVQGQVSIFLQEVEVMEALRVILETSELALIEDNGILKVITQKDYEAIYGRPYKDSRVTSQIRLEHIRADVLVPSLEAMKTAFGRILFESRTNTLLITEIPEVLQEMKAFVHGSDSPNVTRVFSLRYAKAEELEEKLLALREEGSGILQVDKDSNRVLVTDTKERVKRIASLIKAFDVRQLQVLIEAKVIEVKLNDNFRFGIDWSLVANKLGSWNTLTAAAAFPVSAPASATLTALTLGAGEDDLKVVIQMIEKMGKTNTLSSPRLTVLNREEAKLAVATKEPFVAQTVVQSTTSSTTADNVQFVDVGVTLKVSPTISDDGFIELKVSPQVSTSGTPVELQGVSQGSNTAFTRTRIPVVTTQELETTVLVKSGTTIVIGGLIQDKQDKQMNKLPILGNIPVLGRAFSSKSHDFTKTELVIFLTPTIVDPGKSTRERARYLKRNGALLPHRQAGGEDFRRAYHHSQDPVSLEDIPYWEETKPVRVSQWLPEFKKVAVEYENRKRAKRRLIAKQRETLRETTRKDTR